MAKKKWNWRERFHHRLFIDLENYLDEDWYLRIEYLTHREVRFLFGGMEVWFTKEKGYCAQTRPEHRTTLPFPQYAFLRCLAEALMVARWRGFKTGATQLFIDNVAYPRFYTIGRAHVTFRVSNLEMTYHRDHGWQLSDVAGMNLSSTELAEYKIIATRTIAAIEATCQLQETAKSKRQKEAVKRRLQKKNPHQGILDLF